MVIKLHKSIAVHASLKYVIGKMDYENNKIVMIKNVPDSDDPLATIRSEFRKRDIANIRTERVSFHASINPTVQELDKMNILDICKEYMIRMGYGSQPYIVVEHNDTGRKHFHIISHRIGLDGKKINTSNEIIRTNMFVRELNKRYKQSQKNIDKENTTIRLFNPEGGHKMRQIVDIWRYACSYSYLNIQELKAILFSYGVEMIEKDGKYFAAGLKSGERDTRAVSVEENLIHPASNRNIPPRLMQRLHNIVRFAMDVSLSELHAKNILARKDIGLTILRNQQGYIYGVYIIDHKNKFIIKASDIAKDISANQWQQLRQARWNTIKIAESVERVSYNCLSWLYAGDFMYNYWESGNMAYKDMNYTRKREQGRRQKK